MTMGLYDRVYCRRIMPDGFDGAALGVDFQTKSLPNPYLDLYTITPEGRLMDGEHDTNFHGVLNFYTGDSDENWHEYNAVFTHGTLESIEVVKAGGGES